MSFVNCAICPHVFPSPGQRGLKQVEYAFPVDAVYTWVDGSDLVHAAKNQLNNNLRYFSLIDLIIPLTMAA